MHDLHDSRTLPSVLKTRKAISLTGSDTSSGLRVSQIPGSLKVAIFVQTTDDDGRQTKLTTLSLTRMCARGNNNCYCLHARYIFASLSLPLPLHCHYHCAYIQPSCCVSASPSVSTYMHLIVFMVHL